MVQAWLSVFEYSLFKKLELIVKIGLLLIYFYIVECS